MGYYGSAGHATTPSDHLHMSYVYSDRPLTVQECFLARLWLRDRVVMAALELLSLRLDDPKLNIEEVIALSNHDTHALLVGLHLSIRDDYRRQMAHLAWEHTDPHKETRH